MAGMKIKKPCERFCSLTKTSARTECTGGSLSFLKMIVHCLIKKKKKKNHRLFLFLWWKRDGKMAVTHFSFLVAYLSHLSPLFTYELWPRKMERRKLCSVGHSEDPVWNWNEHESLSLLSVQKRPSDSFCPPVPQKKITEAPVFDLNVHYCVTDRRSFLQSQQNKTISLRTGFK